MPNSRRGLFVLLSVAAASLAAAPRPSAAEALYTVIVTFADEGSSASVTTTSANLGEAFETILARGRLMDAFRPKYPSFSPDYSALTVVVHARGLDATLQTAAGSPTIALTIPSIGYSRTFTGHTRDESLKAMHDALQNDKDFLARMSQQLTESSPADPLAGNPTSAQARTVNASFDRGFGRIAAITDATGGKPARDESGKSGGAATNANTASMGAQVRFGLGEYGSGSYTLPLGYSWRFDDDVRHQISLELPLTYQSVEGGHVYSLAAGLGYSHPINDYWVLTAGIDYARAISGDLGANGSILTGTITSLLTLPVAPWLLVHVGNMVGRSASVFMPSSDFVGDPGISNTVLKNGLMLYFPTGGLLRSSGIELFGSDTRFFGSRLFSNHYTELGASYGFSRVHLDHGKRYDNVLRIGVSAIIARNNNGLTLNTGYFF